MFNCIVCRKWLLHAILLLSLTAAAAWLLSPLVLVAESSDGEVGLVLPIVPGETFTLRFIHSVHLTPVAENFSVVGADGLDLTATEFQSYGVGMPSLPSEGKFEQVGGRFRITGLDRHFREIPLRVWPKNRLTLIRDNREYPLYEIFKPESLVFIRVKYDYLGLRYSRPSGGI